MAILSSGQLLNRSSTPIKALQTLPSDALLVELLKKLKWVVVADLVEEIVVVITVDHVKCLTPLVLAADRLARFLSNRGWMKTANRSNQFFAITALNHKKADPPVGELNL